MIALGSVVQDAISGFEGIATSRTEYLHSSPKILVETRGYCRQRGQRDARLFDEARLIVIEVIRVKMKETTGETR